MDLKRSKPHFILGSAIILLGIVLFTVAGLKFLGMGITFSGLMLVFIGIYWATKRKTEIPVDEMHIRINEKAGSNAFWAVMRLVGILGYVTHYFPDLLRLFDIFRNGFKNHREHRGHRDLFLIPPNPSLCSLCPLWFNLLCHDPISQKKLKSLDLLEIREVLELVIIVGMFTFGASRFYYIRRGLS